MMMDRLACLFVLLFLAPAAGAQEVKLKAALHLSVKHPIFGVGMARLKEEVEKRSAGAISIQIFDNGQLARGDQIVETVRSGGADIGTHATHSFVKRAPALSIFDLPFLFNFRTLMEEAAKPGSEMRMLIDNAILEQVGVRVLFWQTLGDMVFYSKGRDVADLARFKDQRVAVPGVDLQSLVERCGGKPSPMTVDKFHDAIKNDEADMAGMVSFSGLKTMRLWGVTDTVTYTNHAPSQFIFIVNEKTWQSLTPTHRAIMIEASRVAESEGFQRVAKVDAATASFAADNGIKIKHLTHDEVAEWRACSAGMLAEYMERNGELAQRLMAAYAKLRTDACCTAGPSSELAFTRR
jgi:TRAP-type C4-dicarboxylate transport system substrate-binding protein